MPQQEPGESYLPLSVHLTVQEVRDEPAVPSLPEVEETPAVPEVMDQEAEIMPDSTDTEAVKSDKIEVQESPEVEKSGQDEMKENRSAVLEPVDNTITPEIIPETGKSETELEIPPSLDISWQGGTARKLLRGDTPSLDISRNSFLMEQVRISFSVYPDGAVFNVHIEPPGSNSFQVDRQLREWASLLLFEALDSDETSAEGLILVSLTVRGIP